MIIKPNTVMNFRDGKRRVAIWLRNLCYDGAHAGLIYFHVNIKQASRSFSAGDGYVDPVTHQVFDADAGAAECLMAALLIEGKGEE